MKVKVICKAKNVHTTVTVTKTSEDGIHLKCDACGAEWSDEIGRYAYLFQKR